MKTIISVIIFILGILQAQSIWGYELEKILEDGKIFCPQKLEDVDGDGAKEWLFIKHEKIKYKWGPQDTRVYVFKLDRKTSQLKFVWKSQDVLTEGGGDNFDGKIYFGDLDGNGTKEIIFIGWRSRTDEETRGYPYEGNIYVFAWDGKTFKQVAMTKQFKTYHVRLKIADVYGNGHDSIIVEDNRKLYVIKKEGETLKGELLVERQAEDIEGVSFVVDDLDDDGKNEIMFEDVDEKGEKVLTIVKYESKEGKFKPIYKKKFPRKYGNRGTYLEIGRIHEDPVGTIEVLDNPKTKEGYRAIPLGYDGNEHYFRFIPKAKPAPNDSAEEKQNKLKEVEVEKLVFKEKIEKFPGLKLPDGTGENLFADLNGDGKDELITCRSYGVIGVVSIYKIK